MKRVRSIHGDTSGQQMQSKASGGGKKSKTMIMAKAAPPENCRLDHNPPEAEVNASNAAATANGLAAAEAAAAVMEKTREEEEAAVLNYNYNCEVVDYEQMWWGSIWLPIWDVENYLVDDFIAAGDNAAAVGWDIDDIWNFKGLSTNYY
ncbi:hypothetical protein LINGRAHAP2_LOCUS11207 [Linum grandiflorum]